MINLDSNTRPARDVLNEIYLDWVNNYVSVPRFAECNGLTLQQAHALIHITREIHQSEHPDG